VILTAQLNKEYSILKENIELNKQAWERIHAGGVHELDWAALGYTLHTIYTTLENYFLRIAKTFENHIEADAWHRNLVEAMQLELPGIRPALLDRKLAELINELRGFRHVFRSIYESRIDPEKISLIQKKIPRLESEFKTAHETFCRSIADEFSSEP